MKTIELCKATRLPGQECRAKVSEHGGETVRLDIEIKFDTDTEHGPLNCLDTHHLPLSADEAREFGLALISAADSLNSRPGQ